MTTTVRASRTPEPASFRDPEARVVYSSDGEVLRELSPRAREDWQRLERARFFRRALEQGRVVATEEIEPGVLRHERLPFVSYPYEWPFEMLRAAALLELELLELGLQRSLGRIHQGTILRRRPITRSRQAPRVEHSAGWASTRVALGRPRSVC